MRTNMGVEKADQTFIVLVLLFSLITRSMGANMGVEKADQTVYEGDAGGYYVWSNANTPLLSESKLSAAKLVMHPLGFVLPHYVDSSKIGYIIQGSCTVGLVWPNSSEEKVVVVKKGDAIPIPKGVVSWWFNGGDTDVVLVYLGETTQGLVPGQITYFIMSGIQGFLHGFQSDLVGKIFDLDQNESENVVNSQQAVLLVKLGDGTKFPEPSKHIRQKLYATIDDPWTASTIVKGGGLVNLLTKSNFPLLGETGISANFVKLEGNAILAPTYVTKGWVQISYVAKGSGRIRVVGSEGKPALDSTVEEGDLFIVPQFYATALIADESGMEVFSIISSSDAIFGQLAGKSSFWNALSPVALQSTLNISEESAELFKSKNTKSIIIVPSK